MSRDRRFWWGFLAGAVSVLVMAGAWAGWAVWRVDRALDLRESEWTFGKVQLSLPAPSLRIGELGRIGYDWRMLDVRDGRPFDGRELRNRVLFVNLWDPGCMPCRGELPNILALEKRAGGLGVQFLSPVDGRAEAVREFLARSEVPVPGRVLVADRTIPSAFTTDALPTTLIADREGRIVVREIGAANWNDDRVLELLRRLSGEPQEPASDQKGD